MQSLKLFIILFGCHYAAFWILRKIEKDTFLLKLYLIASGLGLGIATFFQSALLGVIVLLVFLIAQGPKITPDQKIALFLALGFLIPDGIISRIDFFGVYLGDLTYSRILILGLLLGVLVQTTGRNRKPSWNSIDMCSLGFLAWLMLSNLAIDSITGIIRDNLWVILQNIVPYLAIRLYFTNSRSLIVALAFALISQALISIAEGTLSWRIYETLKGISDYLAGVTGVPKYRDGFMRSNGSFGNPLIMSLFATFAFLMAWILNKKYTLQVFEIRKRKVILLFLIPMSLLAVYLTGSRAGLIGIGIVVLFLPYIESRVIKLKSGLGPLLVVILISILAYSYVGSDYMYETFAYRLQVFEVSSEVIKSNLLFGSLDARSDPRMEVLRQGEGIIDIVNSYIWITLFYGLIGVILFVGSMFFACLRLLSNLRYLDSDAKVLGIFCVCSIIILATNLVTTSPIGWTFNWIWILMPISANLLASRSTN